MFCVKVTKAFSILCFLQAAFIIRYNKFYYILKTLNKPKTLWLLLMCECLKGYYTASMLSNVINTIRLLL